MKLLVADDSKVMRSIVIRTIKQAGMGEHEIVEAENGADALSRIDAFGPDLVVSDWNMPEMTGIELLRALREAGKSVPFVFVTSEGTPEMRALAAKEGARALIEKPFTPDTFKAVLAGVLA